MIVNPFFQIIVVIVIPNTWWLPNPIISGLVATKPFLIAEHNLLPQDRAFNIKRILPLLFHCPFSQNRLVACGVVMQIIVIKLISDGLM